MTTHTTELNPVAIALGIISTAGALILLLGFDVFAPQKWTPAVVTTVLLIIVTILSGHLFFEALGSRRWFSGIGFAVVFAAATMTVVINSAGNQKQISSEKDLSADKVNQAIAEKQNDINDSKDRRGTINDMITLYTNGGRDPKTGAKIKPGCGDQWAKTTCNDWKRQLREVDAYIATLETQLSNLGPQKPVNSKAENIAGIFEFAGAKPETVKNMKSGLGILEPFMWPLLFELGSIVAFGFSRRRTTIAVSIADADVTFAETKAKAIAASEPSPLAALFSGELPDGEPPKIGKFKPDNAKVLNFPKQHPVIQALKKNGGSVASNRELAALQPSSSRPSGTISEGECSKRVDEVEALGLVERQKAGKEVRISLRRA